MMQGPMRVTIGSPPVFTQDIMANVGRGEETTATVFLGTPASIGAICDHVTNYFPVTACANLNFDPNPANNCRSTSVGIAVPYFDLRYTVNGPTNAHVNDTVNWIVTVHNAGNVWSPDVCSRTAIGLHQGDDYLDPVTGSLRLFNVAPLAPGGSVTLSFNAVITRGALPNQFIKAGVDTFSGCFDLCPDGNQDDKPISICAADLNITDIEMPANLIGGVGPRTYYVTVRNDGCDGARGG